MSPKNRKAWPLWLTVKQAAELLQVDPGSIYEQIRLQPESIPHRRIGRAIRIDRDGLFMEVRNNKTAS